MYYAIIDIETTGGSARRDKITEIAIYIHDGRQVVDEFVSLIHPERYIPQFISSLTGITQAMVANAPKFYEVARKIVEITDNCIFVAHNVSFDYHFVKEEFRRLEFTYKRKTLCTLQESKRLFPGYPSYSLGKLGRHFGIEINGRHRAAGDAAATVQLFEHLLERDPQLGHNSGKKKNARISSAQIDALPQKTGLYYFYNDRQELIYIGKSTNIHDRVVSHFNNDKTQRAVKMRNEIASIDYVPTGSELIALLRESEEIKALKPVYNRAQRRVSKKYGLYSITDEDGYIRLIVRKTGTGELPLTTYNSMKSAKSHIMYLTDQYQLCQKLNGLYDTHGSCFHYNIGLCKGACVGEESPESYNTRAKEATDKLNLQNNNFLVIDRGRDEAELSFVLVENGVYQGLGYGDREIADDVSLIKDVIENQRDNRDVHRILRNYLAEKTVEKIIYFK